MSHRRGLVGLADAQFGARVQWERDLYWQVDIINAMTHVITEPCIGTKDTACVDVCPVDCIHPTKDASTFETFEMLYIDPDTCIDCGLCVDECPVQAIFPEEDLPEEWLKYIQVNADWFTENG